MRLVRTIAPRALAVLGIASFSACLTYDQTEGSFNVSASGGIATVSRGRAVAYQYTDLSGVGYNIALDLANASPPMNRFTHLIISTRKRPNGGVRFVHTSASPNEAKKSAWITLATPSGTTVEWLTDSGTIDFKRTNSHHGVAGDFVAYLSCPRCGPGNTRSRAVLRGNFETRD